MVGDDGQEAVTVGDDGQEVVSLVAAASPGSSTEPG